MTHKFISLPVIIGLVFSAPALAQIQTTQNFASITEDSCWMKECKAEEASLPIQRLNLWKTADAALAEKSRDPQPGFHLKSDPATEPDPGLRFLVHSAQIPDGPDSVLVKQMDDTRQFSTPYASFRNEDKGFGAKLLRASMLTHTAQITNLMLMIRFPDAFNYSCSSWAEAKSNLHRAWTSPPVWDEDPWMTNFIGHPYAGGFYYNMLRSQGSSSRASFLYSTGQSLLWEFVIEGVAEQPSIQDLLVTSNLGSVFGELSHRATLRMSHNGFSTFEKILTTVINPVYVINNGFNKQHGTP